MIELPIPLMTITPNTTNATAIRVGEIIFVGGAFNFDGTADVCKAAKNDVPQSVHFTVVFR